MKCVPEDERCHGSLVMELDFLGRFFKSEDRAGNETLSYRLKRWENSIVSLVEDRILKGTLDENAVARCAQQIVSFRCENPFNPTALDKLEQAIVQFNFGGCSVACFVQAYLLCFCI